VAASPLSPSTPAAKACWGDRPLLEPCKGSVPLVSAAVELVAAARAADRLPARRGQGQWVLTGRADRVVSCPFSLPCKAEWASQWRQPYGMLHKSRTRLLAPDELYAAVIAGMWVALTASTSKEPWRQPTHPPTQPATQQPGKQPASQVHTQPHRCCQSRGFCTGCTP
jgi:hypothetical protein